MRVPAAGGMSIGSSGMMVAAKTMALTAVEVYLGRVGSRKPPLDYRNVSP